MLNRSNFPIEEEDQAFPCDFRATCMYYTQHYKTINYLHYHNFLEIGHCFDGSGVQFIDGDVYSFNASSVSIVQKGCIHDSHIIMVDPNEKPSEWKYIFVDLEALGFPPVIGRSFISSDQKLLFLFELMFRELEDKPGEWQEQFRLLLPAFLRIAQRKESSRRSLHQTAMADRISSILHVIAMEYADDLSVEQLASRCNMSVSYFRKAFYANVGMSPRQYMIHVRLSMAEHLLRTTEKTILDIAGEVGFHSLSSLNRLFRRTYGCSPRALRAEHSSQSPRRRITGWPNFVENDFANDDEASRPERSEQHD